MDLLVHASRQMVTCYGSNGSCRSTCAGVPAAFEQWAAAAATLVGWPRNHNVSAQQLVH
jgi:hypothetical protein